jgi:alkylation response protein AidB-like acyl-CoA dehydrogenase
MRAPGVEVRPIRALDGRYHNCEVFYDNVRIPQSNVVGEIDGGWSVAMTTFSFERGPASFGSFCEEVVVLEDLIDYARTHGAADDFRDRLAMARAQAASLRALVYHMVSTAEQGGDQGSDGSILHLAHTELQQVVTRLALDIHGPDHLSRSERGDLAYGYFKSFADTIAGGTSEIQRNIIGERMLGLAR